RAGRGRLRARAMDGNAAMTADQARLQDADDRYARVVLSILTDPGDEVLAALLRRVPATEIAAVVMSRHEDPVSLLLAPRAGDLLDDAGAGELGACVLSDERGTVGKLAARHAIERWRKRRAAVPPPG